jgi:hypothetical protein
MVAPPTILLIPDDVLREFILRGAWMATDSRKDDDKDRYMPVHDGDGDTLGRIEVITWDRPSAAVGRRDQSPHRGGEL